jgi:outer membrane protein TolC
MNKSLIVCLVACAFAASTSCKDIGRGGTGEMVVPEKDLREIRSIQSSDIGLVKVPATTLPSTRATTTPVTEIPLTLADVRQRALANNLDIQVELISPAISRESLNAEEARYETLFTTQADYGSNDAPQTNAVEQQISGTQSQSFRVTPGITQPLRTGGEIDVNVPMSYSDVEGSSANTINPLYTSDAAISIRQPLLRGGGIDVNAQGIRIAFYGYQQAQARTKLEIIRVLAEADRVYWRLYQAREALRVRRQEFDLAVVQLERARRTVRAGAAAEVEIVRAQSGVADRVEAIINAENLQRDVERILKRILNSPDLDIQSATTIIPATPPQPVYFELDIPHLIAQSMGQRMELLETELQISLETANVRVARHETLPLLSIAYTYNINGLGDGWDESFEMVGNNDFADHRAGMQIEVPIGNEAARSRLRRAMLNRLQALATRQQRELQIRQEVLNTADQLSANWQRILAARQRVLLAQRLLEVEIRQFEQGLRTSTEVLNAQTNLASAQLSEVSAITDYQIAQIDIAFATGTVLGASNVDWQPVSAPKP